MRILCLRTTWHRNPKVLSRQTSPVTNVNNAPQATIPTIHSDKEDPRSEKPTEPASHPNGSESASIKSSPRPNTALNAFKLTLGTLSAASDSLPVPGLKLVIESLLTITNNIQQSSENVKGFRDLAEHIKRLEPIFSGISKDEGAITVALLEDLRRELMKLTSNIQSASSQGRLARFLNSADDASSLASHIATLDHIIADLTLATSADTSQGVARLEAGVREIQGTVKSLHATTVTKAAGTKRFGRIIGGMGGAGGHGNQSGGDGGKGGSFKMKMATQTAYEFGDLEVGQGGAGGNSEVQGGRGGVGGYVEITEE